MLKQALRLADKIAIITGAASGIGKRTAAEFIENGAKVFLADVKHDLGAAVAAELGPNATFVKCDVTVESQVAELVDLAVAKHGRLDIMYNNAGYGGSLATSITDLDLEDFDQTIAVNVRATLAGVKHAARVMIPRRQGSILCTASTTGMIAGLAPHDYSISKTAVIGVMRSATAELSRHGVRINCISPHAVATPFIFKALGRMMPGASEEQMTKMVESSSELSGAKLETVDLAKAALFLASDEAKFISGHTLVVDGGFIVCKKFDISPPEKA